MARKPEIQGVSVIDEIDELGHAGYNADFLCNDLCNTVFMFVEIGYECKFIMANPVDITLYFLHS